MRKRMFFSGKDLLRFHASSEKAMGATKREEPITIWIRSSKLNEAWFIEGCDLDCK